MAKSYDDWKERNRMVHVSLDIPVDELDRMQDKIKEVFKRYNMKSYAFRILMHGWLEGFIDIRDIEKKLEKLPYEMFVGGQKRNVYRK